MVVNGDYHEFEPEKLRGLMKILPEMDEVQFVDEQSIVTILMTWSDICLNIHGILWTHVDIVALNLIWLLWS